MRRRDAVTDITMNIKYVFASIHILETLNLPVRLHHSETTGNACMIWSDESFTPLLTSGKVNVYRTPKEAYILECLVPAMKHRGESVMVCTEISWHSSDFIINLHGQITARESSASHNPDLISEQGCSFPRH